MAIAAISAFAGDIYISDGANLYLVDTSTLNTLSTVTLSSAATSGSLNSLAYDPTNGLLYANAQGSFESIDPFSGLVTMLPGTGLGNTSLNSSVQLAFDGNGNLYGLDSDNGQFDSISLAGDATYLSAANLNSGGLGYDPTTGVFETLYGGPDTYGSGSGSRSNGDGEVDQVDPLTGQSSTLFSISQNLYPSPATFTVDSTGTIFAICDTGSGSGSSGRDTCSNAFYSVDPTGVVTQLSQYGDGDVLAAVPSFAPEPSAVVLLLSGGIGLFAFRKKFLR